jgi:light-regulated signal transduction histidine kinase (bacteriophytochrome)
MAEIQLVQVFSHLISNGIKYCHRGRKPCIHISATEQGDFYVFCVKDNGIGLEMQYAETIFGMFKRLHGDEYEGSGIGLAVCKAVVERNGGRIWVESQVGLGTSFYFTLPKSEQAGMDNRTEGHRTVSTMRASA